MAQPLTLNIIHSIPFLCQISRNTIQFEKRLNTTMKRRRVCVIGAGAAGLIALRHIKEDPAFFGTCFEQTDSVGGVWKYNEKVGNDQFGLPIHSTAYQGLRTNLPKEIMGFLDYPFPESPHSYITHEEVLKYLSLYAAKNNLTDFIQFTTRVINVEPSESKESVWKVTIENLKTRQTSEHLFEAILVCNGHYTKALVPDIKNLDLFEGEIWHSRDYRKPDAFLGKRVVVLGAGPSAIDISLELLRFASKVILSCKGCAFKTSDEIEMQSPIIAATSKSLITASGTELPCDALLLCSGYLYDYPFVSPKCGVEVQKGKYIYPLYRQIVNAKMPSMTFVGIPFGVCPFPQFDLQVRYSLKVFKGEIELPNEEEMIRQIKKEEENRVRNNVPFSHSHKLAELQWDYNKILLDDIGDPGLVKPVIRKIYEKAGSRRKVDSVNYKFDHVRIIDDDSFEYTENVHT